MQAFGAGLIGSISRRAVLAAGALALAAAMVSAPSAALAAPTTGWGRAQQVAGIAQINSVSCASPGNCTAGGVSPPDQGNQAMVVSEVRGRWQKAIVVPGSAALNAGEGATINSVSCASAGNCSVGGFYADETTAGQVFVASQVHGTWHRAVVFPGITAANTGFISSITSVSCASPGNCSAAGYYTDNLSRGHLFVASQVKGTWGQPVAVAGTAALSAGQSPGISSVSCASAGNCVAGGWYFDAKGHRQAFLVSQVNGTWRRAFEVPGTATLNSAGVAETNSVSCSAPRNCSAGGFYEVTVDHGMASGPFEAFTVSEVKGVWHKAIEVPGTAALNKGDAALDLISCASPGNCAAGGDYIDNSSPGIEQPFLASQVNGTWRTAFEVPGTKDPNVGPFAGITGLSCRSAGNCSAGGFYTARHNHRQAFVISQVKGTWLNAIVIPGSEALNLGGLAQVTSISCASATNCAAVGSYAGAHGGQHAFVVTRT